MNNSGNIENLFSGFVNGKLTPEELSRLFQYFDVTEESTLRSLIELEMQADVAADSDTSALNDQLEHLYTKISDRIGAPQRPGTSIRKLHLRTFMRYAASLFFVLGLGWLVWKIVASHQHESSWNEVATKYERRKIVLPDGTHIWLAPQTVLRYPGKFGRNRREVELNGEAFFDVSRDPKRPFTIQSGKLTTRVLGTSFNVDAYSSKSAAKVTVVTGKVAVTAGSLQEVKLTPNMQAFFDIKSGKLTRRDYPEASEMLRRRNGDIKYNGASLSEIIDDIQHISAYRITAAAGLGECIFYGEMKAGEDPLIFLESVCRVNSLKMIRDSRTEISISGKRCQNQ